MTGNSPNSGSRSRQALAALLAAGLVAMSYCGRLNRYIEAPVPVDVSDMHDACANVNLIHQKGAPAVQVARIQGLTITL